MPDVSCPLSGDTGGVQKNKEIEEPLSVVRSQLSVDADQPNRIGPTVLMGQPDRKQLSVAGSQLSVDAGLRSGTDYFDLNGVQANKEIEQVEEVEMSSCRNVLSSVVRAKSTLIYPDARVL
jgi:hypothetical protein